MRRLAIIVLLLVIVASAGCTSFSQQTHSEFFNPNDELSDHW